LKPSPSTFSLGMAAGVFICCDLEFSIFDSSLSLASVLTFSPSFLGMKALFESFSYSFLLLMDAYGIRLDEEVDFGGCSAFFFCSSAKSRS
jgi:hypothetical protein